MSINEPRVRRPITEGAIDPATLRSAHESRFGRASGPVTLPDQIPKRRSQETELKGGEWRPEEHMAAEDSGDAVLETEKIRRRLERGLSLRPGRDS